MQFWAQAIGGLAKWAVNAVEAYKYVRSGEVRMEALGFRYEERERNLDNWQELLELLHNDELIVGTYGKEQFRTSAAARFCVGGWLEHLVFVTLKKLGFDKKLGHIAAHFRAQGKMVLLLSNTNAAVDVATFAVDDACRRVGDPLRKGNLIRYARVLARAEGYKDRPHLLEFTRLLQRYAARERELLKKCEELKARLARSAADAPDVPQIQFDLAALILERKGLGERRRTEIAELLGQARIVAATLTSAMYNGFAESGTFDVVLVDEASVMPLAVWPYLLHHFGAGCRLLRRGRSIILVRQHGGGCAPLVRGVLARASAAVCGRGGAYASCGQVFGIHVQG